VCLERSLDLFSEDLLAAAVDGHGIPAVQLDEIPGQQPGPVAGSDTRRRPWGTFGAVLSSSCR